MGMGLIGDVGLSSSTSSGAGGSQFGNVSISDESGGGMPGYIKLAALLGGIILAVMLIKRLLK